MAIGKLNFKLLIVSAVVENDYFTILATRQNYRMAVKYLITGATSGLGAGMFSYIVSNVPKSEYAAAPSNEANRRRFEEQRIAFRDCQLR